jgi:hypothetical protein
MFGKFKILLILFCISAAIQAQDSTSTKKPKPKTQPKEKFSDKVFFGGNIGMQFGTITFFEFSPLVGYRINEKVSAGIGLTYQYYQYKDRYIDFKTNVYGGRVFGRYFFTDYLFGHAEYEYLNLEAFDFRRHRVDVGSLMAGGGYYQRFSDRAGIVAMILYNFTESVYTPYTNPIFRVGFVVGL